MSQKECLLTFFFGITISRLEFVLFPKNFCQRCRISEGTKVGDAAERYSPL